MVEIGTRTKRKLIGKLSSGAGDHDIDMGRVADRIEGLNLIGLSADGAPGPEARVVETIQSGTHDHTALLVEVNELALDQLRLEFGGPLIVEDDVALDPLDGPSDTMSFFALSNALPLSDFLSLEIEIVGDDGAPLERASVTVQGSNWIDRAVTDTNGRVTLEMFGETLTSLRRIMVKPAGGFWGRDIHDPMVTDGINRVTLQPLQVGTDDAQNAGWGAAAMNLVATGDPSEPVRVAVIDSGLAATHTDLNPAGGFDFGDTVDAGASWGEDASGHGTHVSGTVAALNNDFGVRGMSPNVELLGFRVFPQATMSKLLGAIDRCIEQEVDVVNLSLGSSSESKLLQQRLQSAREAGILPVAAAGNSGGSVLYPAAFPEALCVAAIGKFGTFPEGTPNSGHVTDIVSDDGQYFAAGFTCRGPEVDVCAPGVAIVSCVPPNGYADMNGTSMASPHVAGFAARLMQLMPEIRNMPRGSLRAQALFDAVLGQCQPLGLPDEIQGAGLPVLPAEADRGSPGSDQEPDGSTPSTDPNLIEIQDLISQALVKAKALT